MPNSTIVQSGKLRHRIQIADLTLAQDSSGGTSPADATAISTVWASVEADTGRLREIYGGQQKVGESYFRMTMRWLDGVHARQLVWFNGRTFQILEVNNPDGRRIMLVLLCVERDESARTPGLTAP